MAREAKANSAKSLRKAKRGVVAPPLKKTKSRASKVPTPRWRNASEDEKLGAMFSVIHAGGRGLSISIDLDPSIVNRAKKAGKTALSHLRDRFTKLLRRRLGFVPDLVLVGEQEIGKKHHIHGVIDLPNTQEMRKVVREAAYKLSGIQAEGKSKARAVDIQELHTPKRWAGYLGKFRHSSRQGFEANKVVVWTRSLGSRGRTHFEKT